MTIYDDIGGAAAVRAVLDAFYSRVLADATLSPFFLGVDIERLKQTQEGFFAASLGSAHSYAGRRLDVAHARTRRRGLNDDVFDRYVTVFERVLVDRRLTRTQIASWLAVMEDARDQISCRARH